MNERDMDGLVAGLEKYPDGIDGPCTCEFDDVGCEYCTDIGRVLREREGAAVAIRALQRENEALREAVKRLREDRHALLNMTTTEGLSAAEWQMRTAKAGAEHDRLQRENEALREALMHIYEVTHPELESATDPNTVEDVWVTAGRAIRCREPDGVIFALQWIAGAPESTKAKYLRERAQRELDRLAEE